ncbi:hypothetical protein MBAV_004323 [Candidatus Magnetobacterium bavaricum]|uniref:Uncharacterized protein n=1 Tax=Candidatus Magnetobacterium bavaricum TaxID=29290 RepID=A0A0F3GNL6_9BACT|nr:hypothetical protein MBAV_004323 [Candidatus Magnetobacterium bavaricum]
MKNLAKAWAKRLSETKSKLRHHSLCLDDAKVMARLEWMNGEMATDKVRVVLISGDSALQRAAKDYNVDSEHTFADLYIRDPRVFMASPDFLRDIGTKLSERNADLIDWLDVFFNRYNTNPNDYGKSLRKILKLNKEDGDKLAQEFIEKAPDRIAKLKEYWKKCVDLAALEYSFSSDEEQFKNFCGKIKGKGLAEIKEKVDLMVLKSWIDFWKVPTITALKFTNITKSKLPLRGVPALCITLNKSEAKYICSTLQYQNVIENKTSFDDMLKDDQSGYSVFLIYALAFGAQGRWDVCSILSKYAIDIANDKERRKKIPEGHEPITGNEACYLLARAMRHTIDTSEELPIVKIYMNEAKSRKVEATGKEFDVRYESEFIGIDMTYHLFKAFGKESIPYTVPNLSHCQSKIIKLLENPKIDEEEDYIMISVKKQLLVYLFYALLLRQCKDKEPGIKEEAKKIAEDWLPVFDVILNSDSKECRTVTCFTEPVYLAAKHYYKHVPKDNICGKIPEKINRDNIKDYYVMPYDKAFYAFLLDIIADKIKSPY